MNILEINTFNWGSTGNIMLAIAETARSKGHTVYTCCANSTDNKRKKALKDQILIGNRFVRKIHLYLGTYTGLNGCFSIVSTLKFLRKIKKLNIDIIHLHNLHNCYINLSLLFRFIKKNNIKVVWTLHDCWSFTGSCPYFSYVGCNKWQTHCHTCDLYTWYPQSKVDNSRYMYRLKKEWFTGVKNMTLVTPSQWLADLVKQSFLKDYPVKVINNGIDLDVFRPTISDFRMKNNLENKTVLLGVSLGWSEEKGLYDFIKLAKLLNENYVLILVGTDDNTDKLLPKNVISIHRTHNQQELAEIYSASDLFLNLSYQETFGLVTAEAIACGTPALVYNKTAIPEVVDSKSGIVTEAGDIEKVKKIIEEKKWKSITSFDCVKRATVFEKKAIYEKYVEIYMQLYKSGKEM